LNLNSCRHCGKEVDEGELYCSDCRVRSGVRKAKNLKLTALVFFGLLGVLTFMLLRNGISGVLNLSLDRVTGKPAAVVNGDRITRAELDARVKMIRAMLERKYGQSLFSGERGEVLLTSLKSDVLDGMVEERLVVQEARRMGIQVNEEKLQGEVKRISTEVYGSTENLGGKLREQGMSEKDFEENIRFVLLIDALKTAKARQGTDPDVNFSAWLTQARQQAQVTLAEPQRDSAPLGGGCCNVGGMPPGAARPVDPTLEKEAQKAGLEAYRKIDLSGKEVKAKVTDYGCHVQIDIQKEGKIVKSYTYQGGRVLENS
jgi:hypothetical protein